MPPTMKIRTVPRPLCPLCGGRGDLPYENLEDNLFTAPGKWLLRRCANTEFGLCWLDPVASETDLKFLYEDYPTHDGKDSFLGFRAKPRSFFLNGYKLAKLFSSSVLGLNQERRKLLNMCLDDLCPLGRILDVGCGSGDFLHRMHQLGWSVTGGGL